MFRREMLRAEAKAKRGALLPGRYRPMRIKQQTGVRYEQFDFGYYNRTRFAGLENDLANCYANPLLQVHRLTLIAWIHLSLGFGVALQQL